jgi:integrase
MGMIYKRKYKRPDGSIAQGAVWWIKYYRNGIPMRESTDSDKESVAKNLLKQREGDIQRGLPISPRTNRVTFDELAEDELTDYKVNGKSSIADLQRRIDLHLKPYFGGWRAVNIGTAEIRKYVAKRQAEGATNGSINRELTALKRAFTLGMQAGKVTAKPYIQMLQEDNVRIGFFERQQFESVRSHLAPELRGLVTFAYITGWRIPSEVQPMTWRQVDLAAGRVRLDPGSTKNKEGRIFPFTAELRHVLEDQRAYTDTVQREQGIICPYVFHRAGRRIKAFRKGWKNACEAAGYPGRIPHDFRRTAVRNLESAGVSRSAAMKLTGHKTESVYRRYAIVAESDLQEAVRRLEAAGTIPGTIAPAGALALK